MRRALIFLLRCYQVCLSPLLPRVCIYHPSCSSYMITAVETHGLVRGGGLGAWRILRCHPFARGGLDPVPEKTET